MVYDDTIAQKMFVNVNSSAIGVFVSTAAREYTLTARKKVVVVAAGVVTKSESDKILSQSG